MRKLNAFNQVSLDGYFCDANNDMSWAHKDPNDTEWNEFVGGNAKGGEGLVFGRITYDMMAAFWPSAQAAAAMPVVAEGMNRTPKFIFSKTLREAAWQNTTILKGEIMDATRALKEQPGDHLTILGSGSIVSQLSQARLIDDYTLVVNPIVLGRGRTMFDGLKERLNLKLTNSRAFRNGNVVLSYSL